jgi:hypothetical protein
LTRVAQQNGYEIQNVTYWGLPLFPLLLVRKALRLNTSNGSAGFDAGSSLRNDLLSGLSHLERIPQRFLGTSVMAGFKACRSKQ